MDMHLPEELLVNILIRLIVKLLLRFRCVCKSWCSLISHSDFILSHLHHNQVAQKYNVLLRKYTLDYEHDFYSLHSDNEEFNLIQTLDFPIDYFTFAASVNGLICLWDRNLATTYKTVILWNPALKKCITLPELRLNLSIERVKSSSCFGFGYDVSSNDYKVVMLITYRSMIDDYSPDEIATAVFSLSRKSWKTLDCSVPRVLSKKNKKLPMVYNSNPCNVGGFVYNLVLVYILKHKIVSFDLRTEIFSNIACPEDDVESGRWLNSGLIQFHDSLAQFNLWSCDSCDQYNIWVMGDDGVAKSWTKLFSVVYPGGGVPRRTVGFSKKGLLLVFGKGVFLVIGEDVRVVNYVPSGPQTLKDMDSFMTRWQVDSYQESLVLLEEGDDLPLSPASFGSGMYVGSSDNLGEHC